MKCLTKFILLFALSFCLLVKAFAGEKLCYQFSDIDKELLTNIRASLRLNQVGCTDEIAIKKIHIRFQKSSAIIQKAIQPFGYFRAKIHGKLIKQNKNYLAIFYIYLGPVLKINAIEINVSGPGKANPIINKYIDKFPIKSGDEFNTIKYNEGKRKLFSVARNQGYMKAHFENKIIINLKKYNAQIYILLDTGERYYFGPITFKTNIYSDEFMRRFITFQGDGHFSSRRLLNLQQEMEQSYYFRQVIITPDFKNIENNRIPLQLEYTVPKAKRYSFGLGYGTLTGPRISGGLSLRRLNNSGHHFESDFTLSSVLAGITANYFIPGKNPLTDEWLIGGNIKRFHPKAGKSTSTTFTGGYSTKWKYVTAGINLNMLFEEFILYPMPSRKTHALYPGLYLTYLRADNVIAPKNGVLLDFQLLAATKYILSRTDFLQPQFNTKFVYSPFDFSKFIFRTNFGYTTVKKLIDFPFSLRFFAGGINSIRGFADSSIGPGRYTVIGSAEYQNKIYGNLNAAIFYDTGIAANHFSTPYSQGAGVGLVYNTLLGPIKVYLAQAISKDTKPYSVEFSLGPEFS